MDEMQTMTTEVDAEVLDFIMWHLFKTDAKSVEIECSPESQIARCCPQSKKSSPSFSF